MRLSCSAFQAGSSYTQKILSGQMQNYGATSSTSKNLTGESTAGLLMPSWKVEEIEGKGSPSENPDSPNDSISQGGSGIGGHRNVEGGRASGHEESSRNTSVSSRSDIPPDRQSDSTTKTHDSSRSPSDSPAHRYGQEGRSRSKSVGEQQWTNLRAVMAWYARLRRIKRSKSNQRWMKLRTTVQLSGAISSTIQKKAPLKREDSFLKRFSTRQIPEAQETVEIGDDDGTGTGGGHSKITRKKKRSLPRTVVNPDGNFFFYWLMLLTFCVLYNLWTLIVRQSFPELQTEARIFWIVADAFSDIVFVVDIAVQFRTGYLEQGLMVYKTKKLSKHYIGSRRFYYDFTSLIPLDLLQIWLGSNPMLRFPRFMKVYRIYNYYYMVESRTVYPNVWRVVNLIHILLLLAHWFGCFYYLLSEYEQFEGPWVYPNPSNNTDFASLTRKYLGSLYWSTLTLTTIGDLPTPYSNWQYLFTIVSYLIGVFIFATIVGQVGNVITNRNANRLEFERLLDGAKMYMRHHRVPRDMQRRVLRWYDYSWSRGRIQGGGDINTALGLLPDKLKTELALHVNLSVLKKVTIFQECQPEFLHDLVLKMKAYIFTPGDLICRKGEVAREMFIIADGILEVISELGKVLTTMEAGDFFGEIGILNLDGLNKRTADVRSVGYSELFSLSREDVLAAMKDYPEAQEILQTLGKKRLNEARRANAPQKKILPPATIVPDLAKKVSTLSLARSQSSLSHKGPDTPETENNSKIESRIVEKLRSDVRGLRNAIRKSRKSNSSKEDSSDPEKDKSDSTGPRSRKESTNSVTDGKSSLSSSARGARLLKRMHNVVLSDEKDRDTTSASTATSSPAGLIKKLPLDEQPSEKEPEVIGAGLPLMQRLRLLKKKEEKQQTRGVSAQVGIGAVSVISPPPPPPSKPLSLTQQIQFQRSNPEHLHHTKVFVEPPPKIDKESGNVSTINQGKVVAPVQQSFKKLIFEALAPVPPPTQPQPTTIVPVPTMGEPSSSTAVVPSTRSTRKLVVASSSSSESAPISGTTAMMVYSGPSGGGGGALGSNSYPGAPDWSSSESNSWASRTSERPSALHFKAKNPKTYGSVDDLSPEFSRLPFIKKLKILNERQKIAELLMSKSTNIVLTRSTSEGSSDCNPVPGSGNESTMHSVLMGRRTQSSSERYPSDIPPLPPNHPLFLLPPLTPSNENEPDNSSATACLIKKVDVTKNNKITTSTPSSTDTDNIIITTIPSTTTCPTFSTLSDVKTATTITTSDETTSSLNLSPPLSPESNETPERRNLKSILKRLADEESASNDTSEDETGGGDGSGSGSTAGSSKGSSKGSGKTSKTSSIDYQLMRAPTIEGYAARHRKFSKNVTFQRQAVALISPISPEAGGETTASSLQCQSTANDAVDQSLTLDPNLTDSMKAKLSTLMLVSREDELGDVNLGLSLGVAQEECIGGVFLGIKNIIHSRMEEMQTEFQDRFVALEEDIRQRDDVISVLQNRIQELEYKSMEQETSGGGNGSKRTKNNHVHRKNRRQSHGGDGDDDDGGVQLSSDSYNIGSTGLDNFPVQSYLFSRGDSIDTVISQELDDDDVFTPSEAADQLALHPRKMTQILQIEQGQYQRAEEPQSQWTTVSQAETIEMRDLTTPRPKPKPLWQLEFHRDSDPSSHKQTTNVDSETVAVDIGSTSTEYDSSSSSSSGNGRGGDETKRKLVRSQTVISATTKQGMIGDGNSTDEEEEEEDDEESSDVQEEEEETPKFTKQNWEVQMLAKEMERIEEEKRGDDSDGQHGELKELENEIREMRDVVSQGTLSPTELDMLEAVLETKTKRIKGLYKAYSVETSGTSHGSHRLASSNVGRSFEDFRHRSQVPSNLNVGSSHSSSHHHYHHSHANTRDSGGRSSFNKQPLSPGERRDLQKLIFSRKRGGVKRQASLYEGTRRRDSSSTTTTTTITTTATNTNTVSNKKSEQYNRTKRRESADSGPSETKSSFFSRFSFVRQLSRTFHSAQSVDESVVTPSSTSATPIQSLLQSSMETSTSPSKTTTTTALASSHKTEKTPGTGSTSTSSGGFLPLISSTISSALSSSSSTKNDPSGSSSTSGQAQPSSSPPKIFTIPSLPIPAPTSDHQRYSSIGENQPLLKK